MSSAVRFEARIPARRPAASTSPLDDAPDAIDATTAGVVRRRAEATALRALSSLPPTSTIRAAPPASRCVKTAPAISS